MDKWVCTVCGYIYDPAVGDTANNIAAGTSFESLPEDWVCPECGVGKEFLKRPRPFGTRAEKESNAGTLSLVDGVSAGWERGTATLGVEWRDTHVSSSFGMTCWL